ncbi:MAG: SANT/Myb-like DNA-binding domain-containing protein, partial [Candidatus Brocadiales bacterium]|nr:SANT/Myb-like DNA-binding domain-containing protein [Candidatus Brocadiales bacterium]
MNEFDDGIELFICIVSGFKHKQINLSTPLDGIVLKTCSTSLAYIDNRRDALKKYGFDIWNSIKKHLSKKTDFNHWIKIKGIDERILYSKSEQFPDFLFKVRKSEDTLNCGSLLELKDSKGGSVASFNSTLPSKTKNLDEINIINGNDLVSRITSILDGELASDKTYNTYQRRNFYLIRTHKDNTQKVKISIVDGSFFETVPKEHLIYQMFLNILRNHIEKRDIKIPSELLVEIEKSLSFLTDQTIIAASQTIEKASIRPRLRIMSEVHTEGNPHSSFYPEISERSVNLIIQTSDYNDRIKAHILENVSDINVLT